MNERPVHTRRILSNPKTRLVKKIPPRVTAPIKLKPPEPTLAPGVKLPTAPSRLSPRGDYNHTINKKALEPGCLLDPRLIQAMQPVFNEIALPKLLAATPATEKPNG